MPANQWLDSVELLSTKLWYLHTIWMCGGISVHKSSILPGRSTALSTLTTALTCHDAPVITGTKGVQTSPSQRALSIGPFPYVTMTVDRNALKAQFLANPF